MHASHKPSTDDVGSLTADDYDISKLLVPQESVVTASAKRSMKTIETKLFVLRHRAVRRSSTRTSFRKWSSFAVFVNLGLLLALSSACWLGVLFSKASGAMAGVFLIVVYTCMMSWMMLFLSSVALWGAHMIWGLGSGVFDQVDASRRRTLIRQKREILSQQELAGSLELHEAEDEHQGALTLHHGQGGLTLRDEVSPATMRPTPFG